MSLPNESTLETVALDWLRKLVDHKLEEENGKARFTQTVADLSRAFALFATTPEAEAEAKRDEIAFYDALANNESAVKAMGNDELKVIAAELVTKVRQSVTIDWTVRENARAKIRVMVRRILNKHGYPPDLQEEAVKTVLHNSI